MANSFYPLDRDFIVTVYYEAKTRKVIITSHNGSYSSQTTFKAHGDVSCAQLYVEVDQLSKSTDRSIKKT